MALLAKTEITKRLPLGDRIVHVLSPAAATGVAQNDEWIDTGLSSIDAVLGDAHVSLDGPGLANTVRYALNQEGTGGSASNGMLGIETVAAVLAGDLTVTVLGRP